MRNKFFRQPLLFSVALCAIIGTISAGEYSLRYSLLENKPFLLGPTGIRAYGPHCLYRDTLARRGHTISEDFVVVRVDPGAPAEGLVFRHDVIVGANGNRFLEEDPRVDLGWAIIDSE